MSPSLSCDKYATFSLGASVLGLQMTPSSDFRAGVFSFISGKEYASYTKTLIIIDSLGSETMC